MARTAETGEDVRRLAAILDYVAADYALAVRDGRIINEGEYKEQLVFLDDAAVLAGKIPPAAGADLSAGVSGVRALVDAKAPPPQVADGCRALRTSMLAAHQVILAPATLPSRARGAELYATACVECHGQGGGGDGPTTTIKKMDPPPANFLDADTMAGMLPARAFSALTDGIKGTAMASFAAALPAADRWSLAFYVFAMRHDDDALARGAQAYAGVQERVPASAIQLAGATDGELLARLRAAGLSEANAQDALAWLRGAAPFQTGDAPLADCRRMLGEALAAYRAGDHAKARNLTTTAYIDGFDPFEGALGAKDAGLVVRIEDRFTRLKERMAAGEPEGDVDAEALQLSALLDEAEAKLGGAQAGGGTRGVAFASALIIILREGAEAALLILLLLGLARRAGAGGDVKAVHAGWLAAAGVGVVTWFLSERLFSALRGRDREIVEGSVALFAAGVLLWAGHYVVARLDAKRRVDALKKSFADASPSRRRWALAGLGFLAVFREAFEVVLFLRTVELQYPHAGNATAGGAAAGGVLLVGFVVLLGKLGKRLKPGPLLTASGTLLCLLAVILAGKGVRALQEADVLAQRRLAFPRVDWLGLFPTLEGVMAQGIVLTAFVGIAAVALRRSRLA